VRRDADSSKHPTPGTQRVSGTMQSWLCSGCGLRRAELIALILTHLEQRDDLWAIIDLYGNGRHVRTVLMPNWVKATVDAWRRPLERAPMCSSAKLPDRRPSAQGVAEGAIMSFDTLG
jgi:integrase